MYTVQQAKALAAFVAGSIKGDLTAKDHPARATVPV